MRRAFDGVLDSPLGHVGEVEIDSGFDGDVVRLLDRLYPESWVGTHLGLSLLPVR